MSRVLPILFNTEMVGAILDNRKMVTRRIVKQSVWENFVCEGVKVINYFDKKTDALESPVYKAPYQTGDILYVRETWALQCCIDCMNIYEDESCMIGKISTIHEDREAISEGCYIYRADHPHPERITWRPSIHMPKAAARIWLRVTDIKIQRLQEITIEGIRSEGLSSMAVHAGDMEIATQEWKILWDSTIPKGQQALYGWAANPWVWVIEFERCKKPESGV